MTQNSPPNRRVLSVFTLAMINVAAIVSLKNLPLTAEYGIAAVFFYAVATIIFFLPCSLVSAELATGWPKTGGIYIWVKEALGPHWGFLAIWLQWIENVIWYPTVLSFTAGMLAYVVNPELAHNKFYTMAVVLVVFWGSTALNFLGMRASGLISSLGVIAGTIIPGALIIILGMAWLIFGDSSQISFAPSKWIPDMTSTNNIVFLVGVLLSLAGMEMSAVHAQEVKKPGRDYPKAIFLSAIIILILSVLGSLSISIVVPKAKISLVAGIMQAFSEFFKAYHIPWMVPIIAALAAAGAISMVSTWIVGPSKGLLASTQDGAVPKVFQKVNKNGMPVALLILQGVFLTVLSSVFLFMPNVSSSYWILTALTAQLYLIMYLLMFVSAIVLRYKQPDVPRTYKVPGGNAGMWVVATFGALACLFAVIIGFFPPSQLKTGNILFYEGFLICGTFIMCGIPLIIYAVRRPSWTPRQ